MLRKIFSLVGPSLYAQHSITQSDEQLLADVARLLEEPSDRASEAMMQCAISGPLRLWQERCDWWRASDAERARCVDRFASFLAARTDPADRDAVAVLREACALTSGEHLPSEVAAWGRAWALKQRAQGACRLTQVERALALGAVSEARALTAQATQALQQVFGPEDAWATDAQSFLSARLGALSAARAHAHGTNRPAAPSGPIAQEALRNPQDLGAAEAVGSPAANATDMRHEPAAAAPTLRAPQDAGATDYWQGRFNAVAAAMPADLLEEARFRAAMLDGQGAAPHKLTLEWMQAVLKLPFGKTLGPTAPLDEAECNARLRTWADGPLKNYRGNGPVKLELAKFVNNTWASPGGGRRLTLGGPPGVGKSSLLVDQIEAVTGRRVWRIGLAGERSASKIVGSTTAYDGSVFGEIVRGLVVTQSMNPIYFFDEIDKVDVSHGNAVYDSLLDLLDPSRQSSFRDAKLQWPLDLGQADFLFAYNDREALARVPAFFDRLGTIIDIAPPSRGLCEEIAFEVFFPELKRAILGRRMDHIKIEKGLILRQAERAQGDRGLRAVRAGLESLLGSISLAATLRHSEGPLYALVDDNPAEVEGDPLLHFRLSATPNP